MFDRKYFPALSNSAFNKLYFRSKFRFETDLLLYNNLVTVSYQTFTQLDGLREPESSLNMH